MIFNNLFKLLSFAPALLVGLLAIIGCSDHTVGKNEHVWREQTQDINKAKDVQNVVNQQAQDAAKSVEQQETGASSADDGAHKP